MKKLFIVLIAVVAVTVPQILLAASNAQTPTSPINVITNDDGTLHSYVSFFLAGGTQGSPTLTLQQSVNTQGLGIGGGFFGTPRLAMLPSSTGQCLYAS